MKIFRTKVYNLEDAIEASDLPKSLDDHEVIRELLISDFNRAESLGSAKTGSGHDCYLKGIFVASYIRAPSYWWPQFQRYHFADIVSSQSKMHRLLQMDMNKQCNEYVDPFIKTLVNNYITNYNKEPNQTNFQKLVSNVPMGLELTAYIETNYLQLKGIYTQRHGHKLEEWDYFCDWCKGLPKFNELTGIEKKLTKNE